ncbi:FAD-dependent oxidoreductase [Oryzobacter terrae]|uniref:FAD-dependent oxidoreductase n=1 Tax=Oryzobacter terrae TaxID=1620385 RepID=UPI00366BE35B
MRLLVVGGGVAGPAVALAAVRLGLEATVLERRAVADPEEGSWITVAPNGLDALEALGVLDEVRALAVPSRATSMFGATGRHLGDVTLGKPLADGTVALTMRRSALAVLLADAAQQAGALVRRGADVVSVEDEPGRPVRVVLADGTAVEGDLLVAADGVRSRIRRTVDPAAPDARYVGLANFGGITRAADLDPSVVAGLAPEAWHFVFGRRSFFGAHPLPTGDVVWFANVPREPILRAERAATTDEEWLALLGGLVAGDAGPAAALVAAGSLELAGDSTYDLPHVPTWWRERTVLVGDAAHAPSPSSGQGAAMALEDAVVLARAVAAHGLDGPAAYERSRRARVEAVVRAGARSSSAKIPGRLGRVLVETMLAGVFRSGVAARATLAQTSHRLGDPVVPSSPSAG